MVVPVEAPHVRAEIETIFRRLLSDNSQAWTLGQRRPLGSASRPSPASGGAPPRRSRCAAARAQPAPERAALSAVMWPRHHGAVPVAVIDVGSNTVRLHVARGGDGALPRAGDAAARRVDRADRRRSRRRSSPRRSTRVAELRRARPACHGAERVEVLVTSPGRQAANGSELLARLAGSVGRAGAAALGRRGGPARLPRRGRARRAAAAARPIAVCDVGGGSTQIAVGTRRDGADLGALDRHRLDAAHEPAARRRPSRRRGGRARPGPRSSACSTAFVPPAPELALAVGGSARALRDIVGAKLGADELDELVGILARTRAREIVELYGVDRQRVRTLAAGRADPRGALRAARRPAAGRARRRPRGRRDRARGPPRGRLSRRRLPARAPRRPASAALADPLPAARAPARAPRVGARARARRSARPRAPSRRVASARTRCSATTASWWAPITSWRSRSASASALERLRPRRARRARRRSERAWP